MVDQNSFKDPVLARGLIESIQALAPEHEGERLAVGRLVLHDQHARHDRTSWGRSCAAG